MNIADHSSYFLEKPIQLMLLKVALSKVKLEVDLFESHHLIALLRFFRPIIVLRGRVVRASFYNHVDLFSLGRLVAAF